MTILIEGNTAFSFECAASFRMLNVPFREIRNIQNFLSHAKASFAKHEISRNKEHFLRNTKLVSHENLENFSSVNPSHVVAAVMSHCCVPSSGNFHYECIYKTIYTLNCISDSSYICRNGKVILN